ncbi:hypothetical protein P691DRAFT_673921, partial [Macrolepiota fuliginosa MF-IS2]
MKHNINTVGETLTLARTEISHNHQNDTECECEMCLKLEREHRCQNPNTCIKQAQKLLNKLQTKWKPQKEPEENETEENW